MIHYTKNEPHKRPSYYACTHEGYLIGNIEQMADGFYYFIPAGVGHWRSDHLKDVANKLDALNESWNQRLTKEIEACTAFTPEHLPKP